MHHLIYVFTAGFMIGMCFAACVIITMLCYLVSHHRSRKETDEE